MDAKGKIHIEVLMTRTDQKNETDRAPSRQKGL